MGNAGEEFAVGWPGLEGWLGAKAGALGAALLTSWRIDAQMGVTAADASTLVARVRGLEKAPAGGKYLVARGCQDPGSKQPPTGGLGSLKLYVPVWVSSVMQTCGEDRNLQRRQSLLGEDGVCTEPSQKA